MMTRSFSSQAPQPRAIYGARPPVGEEGAAYCVVRRYLWPDEAPPAPREGDPAARANLPPQPLPPGARS